MDNIDEEHPLHLVHVHYASHVHTHNGSENDRFYMARTTTKANDNVAKVKVRAKDATAAKNKAATYMSQQKKRITKVEHKGIITEKKFERIEPTFDPPKPKPPKQTLVQRIAGKLRKPAASKERIEPSFDPPKPKEAPKPQGRIEPTLNGKPHPTKRVVRGEKGRFKSEPIPPAPPVQSPTKSGQHKLVINKDNSVHYHAPDGTKHQLFGSMKHTSSAHQLTLDAVKFIHKQDSKADINVHDASGGYKKFTDKVSKTSTRWDDLHNKREESRKKRLNDPSQKVRDKAAAEKEPTHTFSPFPKHNVTEEHMASIKVDKYAPKKLKDVVARPSRKWSELDGNTKDEQDFVKRFRDRVVRYPDRNGNGDDVFAATQLKRAEKPMVPGEDEHRYAEWNGDVKNIEEAFGILPPSKLLSEAARPLMSQPYGTEKITPRHLDYHWATKHIASRGDRIHQDGNDAVITHQHPDGGLDTTRIENGAKHISEMPKGTYDHKPGDRTDAHAGKHIVMRTTNSYGKDQKVDFVGAKKRAGSFGGHHHVNDESQAKEFKSMAHAHNHANMMNHYHQEFGDGGHPKNFTVHPKRDANQVRASKKAVSDAAKVHHETLFKHGGNIYHPDVEKSFRNLQSAKAGSRWAK